MKKTIVILVMAAIMMPSAMAQNAYDNKTRSYIASQDFVKDYVSYPSSVKFKESAGIVHETNGYGKCTIIAKFTAKNAFGMEKEYVYQASLTHNGGDWELKKNWECTKLIIEDTVTKEQNTFYPSKTTTSTSTTSKSSEEKSVVVNGVKCILYKTVKDFAYIETSKKISSEKVLDEIISKLNLNAYTCYFLTPEGRKTSNEYAYVCKSQNLFLIY